MFAFSTFVVADLAAWQVGGRQMFRCQNWDYKGSGRIPMAISREILFADDCKYSV